MSEKVGEHYLCIPECSLLAVCGWSFGVAASGFVECDPTQVISKGVEEESSSCSLFSPLIYFFLYFFLNIY